MPPPVMQSTAANAPHVSQNTNMPTLTNMTQEVQNATDSEALFKLSQTILQMQVNTMNSANSNQSFEFKDSALPGNQKAQFYRSLPEPWNCPQEITGKYTDEYSRMSKFVKDSGKEGDLLIKFDGDENKYFVWRPMVISHIHIKNVSIRDKYNTIMQTLKRDSDALIDGLLGVTDPTPQNYKNLIVQLEQHYGGPHRAYNHAIRKLKRLRRFDVEDFNVVSGYHCAIIEFIAFCKTNALAHCLNAGTMANTIINMIMDVHQIRAMLVFCEQHRVTEPPCSLFQVQEYLKRTMDLTDSARAIAGLQRQPSKYKRDNQPKYGFRRARRAIRINRTSVTAGSGNTAHLAKSDSGSDPEDDNQSGDEGEVSDHSSDETFDYYKIDNVYYHDGNDSGAESDGDGEDDGAYLQSLDGPVDDGCIASERQYKVLVARKLSFKECALCKPEKHLLFMCPKFKAMGLEERIKYIERGRRCYNCLGIGHGVRICSINIMCRNCKRKHHTLLCKQDAKSETDKAFVEKFLTRNRYYYDSDGKNYRVPGNTGNRRQYRPGGNNYMRNPRTAKVKFSLDKK